MTRKTTPDDILGEPLDGASIVTIAMGAPAQVELNYDGYDDLDEDDRAAVIDRTAAIKGRKRATEDGMMAIGKMLSEVKERLPYGQFGRWLDQEFAWSQDTANRLMRVYAVFGSAKNTRVAESAPSVLAMLSAPSIPEEAREEFRERVKISPQPVGMKEAKEIVAKHKPAPAAPKVGVKAKLTLAPAWKPAPQPEAEPERATPLQQAMLDWARSLPAGQRIFSLKDLAAHRANSVCWPKARRWSAVINQASAGQISDAAAWARLQLVDDNNHANDRWMVKPEQPADLTPAEVCEALAAAFDQPADMSRRDLLSFVLTGPAQRLQAGPGKLVVWREGGQVVLRLNDGTDNPPWLELSESQAAWLAKELSGD